MKKYILLIATLGLLASCGNNDVATIEGKITGVRDGYVLAYNLDNQFPDTLHLAEDGTFSEQIKVGDNQIYSLLNERDILEVYLQNGKTLKIDTDSRSFMKAHFEGNLAEAANLMQEKLTYTSSIDPRYVMGLEPTKFTYHLDSIQNIVDNKVNASGVSSDLKQMLSNDTFFTLSAMRDDYNSRAAQEISGADSTVFFSYADKVAEEVNNPINIASTSFRRYLMNYVYFKIRRYHYEEINAAGNDWTAKMFDLMDKVITDEKVRDVACKTVYYQYVYGKMQFINDASLELLHTAYNNAVSNEALKAEFNKEYEEALKFKAEEKKAEVSVDSLK